MCAAAAQNPRWRLPLRRVRAQELWYNIGALEKLCTRLADKLCLFIATGCGLGLVAPFAPGTFGSLPGFALAFALARLGIGWQIAAALALAALAIPVCTRAEKLLGLRDDGRIAADEWMLVPLGVIGLPLAGPGALPLWEVAIFFGVIRLVDIIKPPPAYALQRLKGGWGVVADDFAANLYSLGVNWALYLLI